MICECGISLNTNLSFSLFPLSFRLRTDSSVNAADGIFKISLCFKKPIKTWYFMWIHMKCRTLFYTNIEKMAKCLSSAGHFPNLNLCPFRKQCIPCIETSRLYQNPLVSHRNANDGVKSQYLWPLLSKSSYLHCLSNFTLQTTLQPQWPWNSVACPEGDSGGSLEPPPRPPFLNTLWKWNNLVSMRPNYFMFIGYLRKMW